MRRVRPYIRRDFGFIVTETSFDPAWVHAIKTLVPLSHRKPRENGMWQFDPRFYLCVKTVTEHFHGPVVDSTGGVAEPQTNNWKEQWEVLKDVGKRADDEANEHWQRRHSPRETKASASAYAMLYVMESAPKEVIKAAYRVLCKINHPDTGGDAETMARVNAAYQELEKKGKV